MAGVEIIVTNENTLGLDNEDGHTLVASIRVRMDSPDDTGANVLDYIETQGYTYGSEYNVGNSHVIPSGLYKIDPPTFVENSQWLWDVKLHYLKEPDKQKNQKPTKKATDLRPKVEVGTIAREQVVEKAFYRGGVNGPGGSFEAVINPEDLTWKKGEQKAQVVDENGDVITEGDGSFSECTGLYRIPNTVQNLDLFPVGHPLAPPIQNSANQPYNPPITRQVTHGTITIERNVEVAAVTGKNFPVDWVNDRNFKFVTRLMVIPVYAYTMRLMRYKLSEEYDQAFELDYVKLIAEFELNPNGWRQRVVDAGTHGVWRAYCDTRPYYSPSGNLQAYKKITSADLDGYCDQDFAFTDKDKGQQVGKALWMDGNGKRLKINKSQNADFELSRENCENKRITKPVIAAWSIYNEVNPMLVPFLRGLVFPL